jgi:hypothetical protein
VFNTIFNRINFHGHLRLAGVCKRWHNLVQNDIAFMRTVRFDASKMFDHVRSYCHQAQHHQLMRSYRYVTLENFSSPIHVCIVNNLEELFKNTEKIYFGSTKSSVLDCVIPLCKNLKEIEVYGGTRNFFYIDFTFQHSLPIHISSVNCSPIIDGFDKITQISSFILDADPSEKFISKHIDVIKSLRIYRFSNFSLKYLQLLENSQLKSLYFASQFFSHSDKDSVQSFLAKQAPYLESIEIDCSMDDFMFDSMRMFLGNLKIVKFDYYPSLDLCLNDLKVLTKLQCLDIKIITTHGRSYQLDISDLTSLTDLRISGNSDTLLRITLNKTMEAIEKFTVHCFKLDLEALEQISQIMPNLKMLSFEQQQVRILKLGF